MTSSPGGNLHPLFPHNQFAYADVFPRVTDAHTAAEYFKNSLLFMIFPFQADRFPPSFFTENIFYVKNYFEVFLKDEKEGCIDLT